jgi:hypothetical protein
MLDEKEFLSEFGIRAVSKYHKHNPYAFYVDGKTYKINYQPAESESGLFGGNSNWRDHILFNAYFHGDNGAGLGAAHQTGWTGLVAKLIQQSGGMTLYPGFETGG